MLLEHKQINSIKAILEQLNSIRSTSDNNQNLLESNTMQNCLLKQNNQILLEQNAIKFW